MDKLKRVLSGNDATPEESDGILPYVSVEIYAPLIAFHRTPAVIFYSVHHIEHP